MYSSHASQNQKADVPFAESFSGTPTTSKAGVFVKNV